MQTDKKYFVDEGIVQGWVEFNTPKGSLRANHQGDGYYHVFVKQFNAFVLNAMIHIDPDLSEQDRPRAIYNAWIEI